MLRMDEINKIRKDYFVNKLNIHQIASKFNRSWATIYEYISLADEQIKDRGKRPGRKKKIITPKIVEEIEVFLKDELINHVPRKQRYSAEYIYKNLKTRGLYQGTSRSIRKIVKKLRDDCKQRKKVESFLELDFPLGKYLQIDHGPATIELAGIRTNGYLFVCSIPGTVIRYTQFYLTKASEAWGLFHDHIFGFFGGTFAKCIYDNDSVLKNPSTGQPTSFCTQLQIHYGFEAIFCNKGEGHEKGSVEGSVGYCRRNYMAGVPQFNSLKELNFYLFNQCQKKIQEAKYPKTNRSLKVILEEVQKELNPLPESREWGTWQELVVDKFQCIHWKNYRYSVPEKYLGAKLKTLITAEKIKIYDTDNQLIISHPRHYIEKTDSLILDHYLEQLIKKPRSIAYAKVLKQQRFPEYIQELHQRLRNKYNLKTADLEFIKILFLKRKASAEDFECAIQIALNYGGITASAVGCILKQLQISQTTKNLSNGYLSEQCSINIDHHFNLIQYDLLHTDEGGESYD